MCGIAGFIEPSRRREADDCEQIARRMVSTLAHRGPDDEGSWADAEAGVALGHRRLSILDLSAEGHQPMRSADGRYVLAFNGEIYNFAALRRSLEKSGHAFRGHSDTEVVLAAFCEWGLLVALEHFVGMFAFALWDRQQRTLSLVRDRAGEKPLYYGWAGEVFVFGSELKALRAHPAWNGSVNRRALALLLRYGYIPSPHSIYENTYKLTPGCVLTLTEKQNRARGNPLPEPYWSLRKVAEAGVARPFDGDEEEAGERLHALLRESVTRQMVADVPVGAFLSGGIDSSLVVALMQAESHRPIKTFSIGFPQETYNEARHAKAVARYLGTHHTELYVQPRNLRQVIPRLPAIYDEPMTDASQIPTVLLCQLTGSQVKVSLSGDAGDELFGGYDHYRKAQRIWGVIARIPLPFRKQLAGYLKSAVDRGLDSRFNCELYLRILNRLSNLSDLLPAPTDGSLYRLLISPNRHSQEWLRNPRQRAAKFGAFAAWAHLPEPLQRMMYLDFVSYLPDDILVKVDRAAMSVGLETRMPLLDHRIVEFAWTLPAWLKQRRNHSKWLLRRILYQYVPPALVNRPKRGFAAPVAQWLRGPLRDWAEELLEAARLHDEGFFEPRVIRQRWREHLANKRDSSPGLWPVLMFQAWLDQQKKAPNRSEASPAIVAENLTEAEACQP